MVRTRGEGLLLGEWACLAALAGGRLHGFAVARRLAPDGDLGRVWTLSRPLTYRALATLEAEGLVRPVSEERGDAGPNRTLLAITPAGRARLRRWVREPVTHLRDLRSELLLKIVVSDTLGIDRLPLVASQRARLEHQCRESAATVAAAPDDPVALWRAESAEAALRFLDRL